MEGICRVGWRGCRRSGHGEVGSDTIRMGVVDVYKARRYGRSDGQKLKLATMGKDEKQRETASTRLLCEGRRR